MAVAGIFVGLAALIITAIIIFLWRMGVVLTKDLFDE